MNQRLRGAMLNAELTPADLAAEVGVDPKTVGRWLAEDRVPYPITRARIARVLNQQEAFLWPTLVGHPESNAGACQVEGMWPTRSVVPPELWHDLFSRAMGQIDILVYTAEFLFEVLDLIDVLAVKVELGTAIRILIGGSESPAVQSRASELREPWLPDQCRLSAKRLLHAADTLAGVEVGVHDATLYASQFRFDDKMMVNIHAFGASAASSPVLRICANSGDQLFAFYEQVQRRVQTVVRTCQPHLAE